VACIYIYVYIYIYIYIYLHMLMYKEKIVPLYFRVAPFLVAVRWGSRAWI
jgi:hypothetical protein